MNKAPAGIERRKYYRINDVVMLRYEVLPESGGSGDEALAGGAEVGISTEALLAELDRELNRSINTVWRENPVLAEALGLLNRKIAVVAADILSYEEKDQHAYDDARVSLSGCGIAFEAREALDPGTRLRLQVILQPSQITLSIAGSVVGCEERMSSTTMPWWIRVDFDEDLQAQEQLIQHVVQKQSSLIAESRSDSALNTRRD
ncbi:MAG: PilZ domain-containing protein [Halieaceae bacterium]|jgi:hypothetical protein|nr:PilZ domain-containing protein [Halieaceae bacterium]